MRSPAVIAVLVLLATMSSASAQPGLTEPKPAAPPAKARPGAHRPAVATLLSAGATLGVIVALQAEAFDETPHVGIAALVVAPAAGRWYVGHLGVPGMLMRGFGVTLVASSFGAHDGHGVNRSSLWLGMSVLTGGVLYDVIGARRTARRQNQRRWAATPTVVAAAGGELAPGVALTLAWP